MTVTDLKDLAAQELPDVPQETFTTVPTPTDDPIADAPEFACEVCGKELTYAGRGRKPRFCEEHRKGGASKIGASARRGGSKDVEAACAALDSWYSMLTMGLMLGRAPQSANLLAESTETLKEKNRTYLAQAPALAKRIADMGKTSATYGFFSAQAMVLLPVAILATGELMEAWGNKKPRSEEEFQEDLPAMMGGVPVG
jgi:hypothetical protein